MLFEPVLERQRETPFQRLVPGAITRAEQRATDLAQRVRLSRTITDLAGELQRALPVLEGLPIPAPLKRQQRPRAVGHRQMGTARQRLEQRYGTRDTLIRARLVTHRSIFLRKQTQYARLRLDIADLAPGMRAPQLPEAIASRV